MSLAFAHLACSRFRQAPRQLFQNGEKGVWFDPSDLSTMFQDSAGTTPVTALGQPVGKILDKSGNGNHATQATSTKRPTLAARNNLLIKSQVFSDEPSWIKGGVTTVIADQAASPVTGATVADKANKAGATNWWADLAQEVTVGIGANVGKIYTGSVWVWVPSGTKNFRLKISDAVYNTYISGVFTATTTPQRFSFTSSGGAGWNALGSIIGLGLSFSTDGTDYYVSDAQLELGSTATANQVVNTDTDYADIGAPRYLQFDGVDDSIATAEIDFSACNAMSVFAGIMKNSDAASGIVCELSANATSNNGGAYLLAPSGAAANIASYARGAAADNANQIATASSKSAGKKYVVSSTNSISGDLTTLRTNQVAATDATGDKGSGNYGNYPLYIGSRGGSSLPYNGRLHGLIVRGTTSAVSTNDEIYRMERWLNSKVGAY